MKTVLKKLLAVFLCVWMLCLIGITAFAANETPIETPTSIKLSATTLTMTYGGTAKLTATVLPEGANQGVKWKSSDDKLVQVDANGNLTAAKDTAETPSGKKTVTITATSVEKSSVSATCTVTVDNDAATKYGSMLSTLLAALKSLLSVMTDPTNTFMKDLTEFVKQMLEILKNLDFSKLGLTA